MEKHTVRDNTGDPGGREVDEVVAMSHEEGWIHTPDASPRFDVGDNTGEPETVDHGGRTGAERGTPVRMG